jgi:hypothetical protein
MERNDEQRPPPKLIGGVTGRGFCPARAETRRGRPHTKGLLTALRNKIAEVSADGRTIETLLVEVLVHEALGGRNRLPAVEVIFDRLLRGHIKSGQWWSLQN